MKTSIVKLFKLTVPMLVIFSSLFSVTLGHAVPSSQLPVSKNNKDSPQLPVVSLIDEATGKCFSLDVIFVIDQSMTMSDPNYPTDPTNQRQTAVQAMVDWLASNVLDVCHDARHRIGVISFGEDSQIDLELTEIAPTTLEDLLALEKRVNRKIVADNLGDTENQYEPIGSFRKVSKMFEDAENSGDDFRKRVVVFLTDGLIGCEGFTCKPKDGVVMPAQRFADFIDGELPFDQVLLRREQCISALVEAYQKVEVPFEKINKCYNDNIVDEDAYEKSTYLYMVLLNFKDSWPSEIKNIYGEVAESHAGEVVDFHDKGEENRQEIPTYFVTVLSKLTGVPAGDIPCGGVVINPYLDKAVFRFFKFSPDTKVSIRYVDANGVEHQMIGGESSTGGFDLVDYEPYGNGTNERYIFNKPYPGVWFIESDRCKTGGINVFYQPTQINSGGFTLSLPNVRKYQIPPFYDISSPTYLTYQMHDDAGEIVDNNDQEIFNINVEAAVTSSAGEVISYPLTWIPEERQFKASEPLQVPTSGPYKVSFVGTTKIHTGDMSVGSEVSSIALSTIFNEEMTLFQNEGLEFTVEDATLFLINILTPAEKQVFHQIHATILSGWPLKISSIPVRVRIEKEDGQPWNDDFSEVLIDPDSALTASVSQGDKKSEIVILAPDPKFPGEYVGSIPNFDAIGEQTLTVVLQSEVAEGYLAAKKVSEVVFTRNDDNPFSQSKTYVYLLYVLAAFVILRLILCFINARNPIGGMLIFANSGEKVFELVLSGSMCARNRHYFGPSSPGIKGNHETMDVFIVEAVAIPATAIRRGSNDADNEEPIENYADGVLSSVQVKLMLNSINPIQKILFLAWKIFLPIPDGWWSRNYVMVEDGINEYGDENHSYTVQYKKV